MRSLGAGYTLFAATLVVLGLFGLFRHEPAAIWQPIPKAWPREPLIWATGLVALGGGLGLFWPRSARPAAGVLTAALLVWMLAVKGRGVLATPGDVAAWESCGETAVLAAAAMALFAQVAANRGVGYGARALYGLALLAFGAAHVGYVKATASLVPTWLPAHPAWVYATAATYIAAGAAVIAGVRARLAAALATAQMGLFTLLVWGQPIAAGHADAGTWSEGVVSWALTAASWAVAETLGGPAPRRR